MKKNSPNKSLFTKNVIGMGPVTRESVHTRASELAVIAGRSPLQVSQIDYEQAKRELTGESDIDLQEAKMDPIPPAERWDPAPDSTGHQVPESPSEDEDDEGRSETEQLVDAGAEEAGRDRRLQASQADKKGQPLEPGDSGPH
ncbi:MAG: hypothetical protein ABSE59_09415 [Opitutaceae bacterium]|jgi:hypothetical protein